jgi:hypothetical protein
MEDSVYCWPGAFFVVGSDVLDAKGRELLQREGGLAVTCAWNVPWLPVTGEAPIWRREGNCADGRKSARRGSGVTRV